VLKRTFDLLLAAAGLLISSPLWLVIAIAIKLQDGGPVLFAQPRVGRNGVTFPALKFRSMIPGAELLPPRQAEEDDPRVTAVGRLLRRTAMDELPQLYNILRGDMSFVGPRPLLAGEIELRGSGESVPLSNVPGYQLRHSVRPGLTGLSQVYAPRDAARSRKFRLDALYVRNATLCLDLFLIAASFWITARGRWEVRTRKI